MIQALLLIFKPTPAWDRIMQNQRSMGVLLGGYLLPMMLLAAAAEGFGMVVWGKHQELIHRIQKFTPGEAVIFETARLAMALIFVLVCAALIKTFADTFRGRNTYQQTLTLVIYGLSPLFLLRMLDAVPGISPWITWATGVVLCTEVLYQGVPRVLEPDPPNAFGLYFMSSVVVVATTGLERFITFWYLSGRMRSVSDIVNSILTSLHHHLPF